MKALVLIASVLLLLWGQAYASEASSSPQREGPWSPHGSDAPVSQPMFEPCETETLTWANGKPATELDSCDWWFSYAAGLETDAARDYGVLWLQTTAAPHEGFCIEGFRARFGADSQFEILGAVESRRIRATSPTTEEVGLVIDADGHGAQPASVLKGVTIPKGVMSIKEPASDGSISARWRSAKPSKKPVNLVVGLEVSWDADITQAPSAIYEIRTETRVTYVRC